MVRQVESLRWVLWDASSVGICLTWLRIYDIFLLTFASTSRSSFDSRNKKQDCGIFR